MAIGDGEPRHAEAVGAPPVVMENGEEELKKIAKIYHRQTTNP